MYINFLIRDARILRGHTNFLIGDARIHARHARILTRHARILARHAFDKLRHHSNILAKNPNTSSGRVISPTRTL